MTKVKILDGMELLFGWRPETQPRDYELRYWGIDIEAFFLGIVTAFQRVAPVLLMLLLAAPARAQANQEHPLRDSLLWSIPLVVSSTFDRQTSLVWSSHPSNCYEANTSRSNPDGTLNGWKAAKDDAIQTGVLVGALYAVKRLHWKKAETVMKVVILGRSAEYAYQGVRSMRNCQVTQ